MVTKEALVSLRRVLQEVLNATQHSFSTVDGDALKDWVGAICKV